VDPERFDTLTRWLGTITRSRRSALHLGGGALVSVGVPALVDARGQAKGDGQVRSQADRNRRTRQFPCKPAGSKCIHKPKKGSTPPRSRLCKACCETFRKSGKTAGRCCIPDGQPCSSAAECCLGNCSVGLCQNTTVQIPPPCVPYGQACAAATDCCLLLDGTPIPCSGGLCRFN
jgi:hypothetical protein